MTELSSLVGKWLEWDQNQTTRQEVEMLKKNEDWDSLNKIMTSRLKFGTAGIRGRMGPGFGQMNDLVIIQVTQGLLSHLTTSVPHLTSRGVVLGYDGRHNSARWARLVAGVFIRHSVPVMLFESTVPTPWLAFTVRERGAACGVMITASHNPRWDNGYKVYWDNGAQILSPHDQLIQTAILDHLEPEQGSFTEPVPDHPLLSDPLEEMSLKYYNSLQINNNPEVNSSLRSIIVYSAMHGVGCPYVVQAWNKIGFPASSLVVVEEQKDPDPDFSTVDFPNPEEGASALDLSFQTADRSGAGYVLANDPDADRLAVAQRLSDNTWKVLTGNEIGALLGWWLLACFKKNNPDSDMNKVNFLSSTVSSKILSSIAKKEGMKFTETLTGFKHMGNEAEKMIKNGETILFAFEEAIGFMVGSQVLDKDGVSAMMAVTEMISHLDSLNLHLTDQLDRIYTMYGFHCSLNSYFISHDPDITSRIFHKIRNFTEEGNCSYPKALGRGSPVVIGVRDLTTGYDSTQPDKKAVMPVSSTSQMITFWLDNGVVITLRTSGTEPKVKYYTELCGPVGDTNWEMLRGELRHVVDMMVEEWIQPSLHGLTDK